MEDVKPVLREQLFLCEAFRLWRLSGESPFIVGETGTPPVLVCIVGDGQVSMMGSTTPSVKAAALICLGWSVFMPNKWYS